jgi:predicted DNA-binding transcriptional regulator AlpA
MMAPTCTKQTQQAIILRCRDLQKLSSLPHCTLYEIVKGGTFPSQLHIAGSLGNLRRAVGWVASEVDAWLNARILAPRLQGWVTKVAATVTVGIQPAPSQQCNTGRAASKCSEEVVKAKQGLTTLTEVGSRNPPAPASIPPLQLRRAARLSGQGTR